LAGQIGQFEGGRHAERAAHARRLWLSPPS
jgi:hypothetical protein